MEKLKIENNKKYSWIFFIGGILILAVTIFVVIRDVQFIKKAVEVNATVVECNVEIDRNTSRHRTEKKVAVYVDYEFDGRKYTHVRLNQREEKEYDEDTVIKVYVDPENTREPLGDSNMSVRFKILFAGIVFFAAGTLVLVLDMRTEKQKKYVKENGITIYAKLTRICKKNKSMNSPIELRCEYDDENDRNYTFISEAAYNDLARYFQEGELIEVKVLPDNYNKYYIDLGALWERKIQSYGLYN